MLRDGAALQRQFGGHNLRGGRRVYLVHQRGVLGHGDPDSMSERHELHRVLSPAWLLLEREHLVLHKFAAAVQLHGQLFGLFRAVGLRVEQCHGYLQRHARQLRPQRHQLDMQRRERLRLGDLSALARGLHRHAHGLLRLRDERHLRGGNLHVVQRSILHGASEWVYRREQFRVQGERAGMLMDGRPALRRETDTVQSTLGGRLHEPAGLCGWYTVGYVARKAGEHADWVHAVPAHTIGLR
jgi:hypothetical protein